MKTKIFVVLLFAFLFGTPVYAQSSSIRTSIAKTKDGYNPETKIKIQTHKNSNKPEEFELYRSIIRKHSWYVGVGEPISQELANKLPYYFKLSMKNDKGNWQHVQAMHGNRMTTKHNISPYIFDKRYDTSNDENNDWAKMLQSVTQWVITPDLSGKEVIEERAYTAEGNLVYSFLPVKIKNGKITGSYNDSFGFPVDMRREEGNTYGSIVRITYDCCGRDSIIDFLDGEGFRKHNNDGVDQVRNVYDNKDRIILSTSNNMVGDYTLDNWGNCGNRYEYINDTCYTITTIDKELKPMRMPEGRAKNLQSFVTLKVILDKYGRENERIMYGTDGLPDVTGNGVHKIVFDYDDYGNLKSTTYYNLNNEIINL